MWHHGIDTVYCWHPQDSLWVHSGLILVQTGLKKSTQQSSAQSILISSSQGALSVKPRPPTSLIHIDHVSKKASFQSPGKRPVNSLMGDITSQGMSVDVNCGHWRGAREIDHCSRAVTSSSVGSLQVLKVDCASCELGVVRRVVVFGHHWRFLCHRDQLTISKIHFMWHISTLK